MTESRKEKRAPAALKVKYKSANVDEFIEQAGLNISAGGIFVKTSKPMPLGVPLRLELQLADGAPVIRGVGKVAWRREAAKSSGQPAGMGIKFIKLEPGARAVVARAVQERGGKPSRYDTLEGNEAVFVSIAPPPIQPAPSERAPEQAEPGQRAPAELPQDQGDHVGEFLASTMSAGGVPGARAEEPVSSWADALNRHAETIAKSPKRRTGAESSGTRERRASQPSDRPNVPEPASAPARPPSEPSPEPSARVDGLFGRSSSPDGQRRSISDKPEAADRSKGTSGSSAMHGLFGTPSSQERQAPAETELSDSALSSESFAEDDSPTRIWNSVRPPAEAESTPAPETEGEEPEPVEPSGTGDVATESSPPEETFGAALPPQPAALMSDLSSDSGAGFDDGAEATEAKRVRESRADTETVPEAYLADIGGAPAEKEGEQTAEEDEASGSVPDQRSTAPSDRPVKSSSLAIPVMGLLALGLVGGGGFLLYQKGFLQPLGLQPAVAPAELPAQPAETAETAETAAEAEPEPTGSPEPKPEAAPREKAPEPEPANTGETMTFEVSETEQDLPAPAKVAISSTPPGSVVLIDDELVGKTPFNAELQVGETVKVSVSAPGFRKATRELVVEPGQKPVRFELEQLPYLLVVTTDPPGASVSVGGRSVVSPEPLDLGQLQAPVTATLSKPGYQMVTLPVRRGQFTPTDEGLLFEVAMKLSPLPTTDAEPSKKKATPSRASRPKSRPKPKPADPAAAEAAPANAPAKPAEAASSPEPAAKPAPKPAAQPAPKPPAPAAPAAPKEEKLPDNPF